jgi:hypothetical protein
MKKTQTLILKVTFDDEQLKQPKNWHWSEIIGCDGDCVEVLNSSGVEDAEST